MNAFYRCFNCGQKKFHYNYYDHILISLFVYFKEPPEINFDNYESEVACLSDYSDRSISTVRCVSPGHCEYMKHCFEDPSYCNYDRQKQFYSDAITRCWVQSLGQGRNCVRLPYFHLNGIVQCQVRGLKIYRMFFQTLESLKST